MVAKPFCSRKCYDVARSTGSNWYRKVNGKHEHRQIAERLLGRKLRKDEVVHHKDEDPRNNKPGNLQIMTRSEHATLHGKLRFGRSIETSSI